MRFLIAVLLTAVSLNAANLVPNSSFEVRQGRGWFLQLTSGNAFNGNIGPSESLLTNGATHGDLCMTIRTDSAIYSRAMWLVAGNYTNTYWAKTFNGAQGPCYSGLVDRSDLGSFVGPGIRTATWTTSWVRYTNSFTATSNGFYWCVFAHNQANVAAIDGVQVELGAVTAYAPMAAIECGVSTGSTNNMWFAGDTPTFTLNFWNEGASTNTRARYEVFDGWNSNLLSGNVSVSTTSGRTTTAIPLPSRYGWMRIVTRITTINDSYDETTACVYPFASNAVASVASSTNQWLGGHPQGSLFHAQRELRAGRHWGRSLSPNYRNTRWLVVEPSRGAFTFEDSVLTNTSVLQNYIGCLADWDGQWPSWATNTSSMTNAEFPYIGSADLWAYSNYCYTVVNRYKFVIKNWEMWNEPYQSGIMGFGPQPSVDFPYAGSTNLPINVRVATNYAKLLTYGVYGVRAADPTARIIAGGGSAGNGLWHLEYWTNLSANVQASIHAISTHIPPQDQGTDPNAFHHADAAFTAAEGYQTNFIAPGIRPVWQTESPMYSGISTVKGLNAMWPATYDVHATYTPAVDEALRSKFSSLPLSLMGMVLSEALRDKGYGFQTWVYYDCRIFTTDAFFSNMNYAGDYNNVDRCEVVSLSIAQHMVRQGFGVIRNLGAYAANIITEMYACTNQHGQAVVPAWNADRTNRTFTLSRSDLAVYDAMGNLVQTNSNVIKITRLPQYLVSGTMTLAQLSNEVRTATVSEAFDVLPPQVSFDIAPSGLWDGNTNATLVKWTGMDDTYFQWATLGIFTATATNVLFKRKLDNGPYSDYSQSNHVWLTDLPAGNHTLYVTAKDKIGNSAEYSYEFMPPPSVLNVSGTARIGVVTILSP